VPDDKKINRQLTLFGELKGGLWNPEDDKKHKFKLSTTRVEEATLHQDEDGAMITPSKKFKLEEDAKYNDEYCFKAIRTEMYLWDMRCWDERSEESALNFLLQVKEYIDGQRTGYDVMNAGHAVWCIEKLIRREISIEDIVTAMMDNEQIQFKNREVKCFGGQNSCSTWTKEKGYSGTNCERCE